MTFEIEITKDHNGVKPKNFLKKRINAPYYRLPKLLKEKRITVNGKKIKEETVFKTGDIIKVWLDELKPIQSEKDEVEAIDLDIPIVFENEDFLVLNKPGNISVQGGMLKENRLINHLAFLKQKNNDTSEFNYFHAHRLDKETSGVLIIAKNLCAIREFNKIFRDRVVKKKYLTLVCGKPNLDTGKIELLLERTEEGIREKVKVVKNIDNGAKKSISIYKVLKTVTFEDEEFSLLEVEIKTGVTHQIRVHMKHLGCPVVCDKMYGNSLINSIFEGKLNRQFLHAKYLKFNYEEKDYELKADLTEDLKSVLKEINLKY